MWLHAVVAGSARCLIFCMQLLKEIVQTRQIAASAECSYGRNVSPV
jgi:hypothetical protein